MSLSIASDVRHLPSGLPNVLGSPPVSAAEDFYSVNLVKFLAKSAPDDGRTFAFIADGRHEP